MKDFATLIQALAPIVVGYFTYNLGLTRSHHDALDDTVNRQRQEVKDLLKRLNNANAKIEKLQQEIEDLKNEKH